MPGFRYHAFSEAPIYDFNRPHPSGPLARVWHWIAVKIFWALENIQVAWAIQSFRRGAVVGPGCRLTARSWCVNPGPRENVRIGEAVICRGLIMIERFQHGVLTVGDHVYLGDDTVISCANNIVIGRFAMLAHGVQLFDNDSHPIDAVLREHDHLIATGLETGKRIGIASAPISVGEGAWIGFNAIVLKGVTIGQGSIVAAGSVVTSNVPPYAVVAGNPARVVRQIAPPASQSLNDDPTQMP